MEERARWGDWYRHSTNRKVHRGEISTRQQLASRRHRTASICVVVLVNLINFPVDIPFASRSYSSHVIVLDDHVWKRLGKEGI
jgi:hypothetical protein